MLRTLAIAMHPGHVLTALYESNIHDIADQLAVETGSSLAEIKQFLSGERDISLRLADVIARHTGIQAATWLSIQRAFSEKEIDGNAAET